MATCEEVINSAFRRARLRAAGVPLDEVSAAVGLERLQGMYYNWATNGLLGQVTDYFLDSGDYDAEENQRVYTNSVASVVSLPDTITDASTGQERAPKDGAIVMVVDPRTNTPAVHVYNGLLGKWQDLHELALADEAPLSTQFDEALKDNLAIGLLSETGIEPSKGLTKAAGLGKLAVAARNQTKRSSAENVYY